MITMSGRYLKYQPRGLEVPAARVFELSAAGAFEVLVAAAFELPKFAFKVPKRVALLVSLEFFAEVVFFVMIGSVKMLI